MKEIHILVVRPRTIWEIVGKVNQGPEPSDGHLADIGTHLTDDGVFALASTGWRIHTDQPGPCPIAGRKSDGAYECTRYEGHNGPCDVRRVSPTVSPRKHTKQPTTIPSARNTGRNAAPKGKKQSNKHADAIDDATSSQW